MKTYVLYHGNCYDGFGSAWAAHRKLCDDGIKYIPCHYGSAMPDIKKGSTVYFLDFSTDADTMRKMGEENQVIVLDHHMTAEKNLEEFVEMEHGRNYIHDMMKDHSGNGVRVRFDMDKSGAMLAWEYFHPGVGAPDLIAYIQDRDLWHHKLHKTKQFSAYLRTFTFDFDIWDRVVFAMTSTSEGLDAFTTHGEICLTQDRGTVKMICSQAALLELHHVPVDGEVAIEKAYKVAYVEATSHWSEIGAFLLEKYPEADYAMSSYYSAKNNMIKFSLRSKGDFSVAEVAKIYGGGGHKNAAGFILEGNKIKTFYEAMRIATRTKGD